MKLGKFLILCIIIGLVVMIILDMRKTKTISKFEDIPNITIGLNNSNKYEKDRTLLYGSLFLDKLNEQIKNMTDPRITYDDKRIDIIKYSDVLL